MSSLKSRLPIRITGPVGRYTPGERSIIKRVERSANQLWRRGPVAEITAVFVTPATIQKLNHQYRRVNRSTTTLSFVYQGRGLRSDPWIGEMMFCRTAIKQRAQSAGQSYTQTFTELIAHSLLHILGYDHQTDAQERVMERRASRIIESLT